MRRCLDIPLDGKPGHTRLLCQDIASYALNNGLGRRLRVELLRVVLVVDVVSHSNKLATVVCTCQEDDSHTKDVGIGDARRAGGLGLEDKLVDANGNRPDEEGVELLVVLIAAGVLEPAQAGGWMPKEGLTMWQTRHRSASIRDLQQVRRVDLW